MLSDRDLAIFSQSGVVTVPGALSLDDMTTIAQAIDAVPHNEGTVLESHGNAVRGRHGDHLYSATLSDLTRLAIFRRTAEAIFNESVYVYQFKINMKSAFCGEAWPWHNDYVFWDQEDGLRRPDAVTFGLFLTEVNEFNGPMHFIPGSHIENYDAREGASVDREADGSEDLNAFVGANLKYTIAPRQITRLARDNGMAAAQGPVGTILLFHSRTAHCSPPNLSPYPRNILFITYCPVTNVATRSSRPDFLVNRDATPLQPLPSEQLLLH